VEARRWHRDRRRSSRARRPAAGPSISPPPSRTAPVRPRWPWPLPTAARRLARCGVSADDPVPAMTRCSRARFTVPGRTVRCARVV